MKRLAAVLLGAIVAVPVFAQAPPADVVTVGSGSTSPGTTIDVPVFIRDTSGSPLGIDQPPGSRIQSYSLTVNYSPASAVQSITFTRGGITQPLTPAFESSPASAGQISLIDVFDENTNLIPFTSNAALPGNQVGTLHVTINPAAATPSVVNLTLDATLTQLSNQAGTTSETVTLNTLTLVNGAINVTTTIPALSTWALALLAIALAGIGVALMKR
jgi:hypothetical protein